jgi:anti-anti-sigma factor
MVRLRDRYGVAVIEVFGDIDVFNADATLASIQIATAGKSQFVLSLLHCRYCDSSGMAMIVKLIREGRQFAIAAQDRVAKVLQLTQLDTLVPMRDNVDDAIGRLQTIKVFSLAK